MGIVWRFLYLLFEHLEHLEPWKWISTACEFTVYILAEVSARMEPELTTKVDLSLV